MPALAEVGEFEPERFRESQQPFEVRGRVPNMDEATFVKAAEAAKDGCPISGALKGNVELSVKATLEK